MTQQEYVITAQKSMIKFYLDTIFPFPVVCKFIETLNTTSGTSLEHASFYVFQCAQYCKNLSDLEKEIYGLK